MTSSTTAKPGLNAIISPQTRHCLAHLASVVEIREPKKGNQGEHKIQIPKWGAKV